MLPYSLGPIGIVLSLTIIVPNWLRVFGKNTSLGQKKQNQNGTQRSEFCLIFEYLLNPRRCKSPIFRYLEDWTCAKRSAWFSHLMPMLTPEI